MQTQNMNKKIVETLISQGFKNNICDSKEDKNPGYIKEWQLEKTIRPHTGNTAHTGLVFTENGISLDENHKLLIFDGDCKEKHGNTKEDKLEMLNDILDVLAYENENRKKWIMKYYEETKNNGFHLYFAMKNEDFEKFDTTKIKVNTHTKKEIEFFNKSTYVVMYRNIENIKNAPVITLEEIEDLRKYLEMPTFVAHDDVRYKQTKDSGTIIERALEEIPEIKAFENFEKLDWDLGIELVRFYIFLGLDDRYKKYASKNKDSGWLRKLDSYLLKYNGNRLPAPFKDNRLHTMWLRKCGAFIKADQDDPHNISFEEVKNRIKNEMYYDILDVELEFYNAFGKVSHFKELNFKKANRLIKILKTTKNDKKYNETIEKGNVESILVTDDLIKRSAFYSRVIEGSNTVEINNDFVLSAQKGINLLSGVSHSGKSYLMAYLAAKFGLKTLYYATDQDEQGFLKYLGVLNSTVPGMVFNDFRFKCTLGNGIESIMKDIDQNDSDVIIFDMMKQIPTNTNKELSEFEEQGKQIEVVKKLKEYYPNKSFWLISSVAKGRNKDKPSLESLVYGNNAVAHAIDFAISIYENSESKKEIYCMKDRYPENETRNNLSSLGFDKITDILKTFRFEKSRP